MGYFDTLLFVEIYSFSDNMFLSVRFRPALDAETYTIIKWMLRKQDRSMNFYEFFSLFIYLLFSLSRNFTAIREWKVKKKVSEHFTQFLPREFRLEHAHKEDKSEMEIKQKQGK